MTQFTGTINLQHITDRLDKLEKSHAEILKAINGPKPTPPEVNIPDTGYIQPQIDVILAGLDLKGVTEGKMTKEKYSQIFGTLAHPYDESRGDVSVGKIDGQPVIRAGMKKGLWGAKDTGMNSYIRLGKHVKEIFVHYKIIPRNVKKGSITAKLPGFAVGDFTTKFNSGGTNDPKRGGSYRGNYDANLGVGHYVYDHTEKNGKWGTDGGAGRVARLVSDQENDFLIRGVMNTGSNADGIVQLWFKKKLVSTVNNIRWQLAGNAATGFGLVSLDLFVGGDNSSFAMPQDSSIDIIDLGIGEGEGSREIFGADKIVRTPWGDFGGK